MLNDFDDIIEKLDKQELWDFPGGVYPAEQKHLSNATPIEKLAIPERLFVTLKQHIGVEGHLIVEVEDEVLKGQALTKSMNPFAVPVHAPTSGKIAAIHSHVSAHPSGLPELTVEIHSDKQDKWSTLKPLQDYQQRPKAEVLSAICHAGISGMGGAGFPTHIKSSPKKDVDFLIINGIECEPYITSDDRLMREHAWQIRQGIDVLCHLLKPKHIIIGIENNKPEAIEAMQVACRENPNYRVCTIPTKYPAGGEKQLIQVLTNREVPAQGLPVDVGVIMHNVGTCFAIADAIFSGKPLIERVVTITGEAVEKPCNVWAMIGTPIADLMSHGAYQSSKQQQANIIMGGPMMGFSVINDLVPVVKTTNCILLPTDQEIAGNNEQACIRCGACADVCPASLLPQQLFWHAKGKELEKAQEYNLFDCIECGACAYVCPSEIPLVHYYRIAKSEIRVEQEEKQKADKARERFEKRAARLLAEQQARDEKHRLAAQARKKAMEGKDNGAKDKIAAALARAKAKKQASSSEPDEKLSDINSDASHTVEAPVSPQAAEPVKKEASSNQRVQAAIARAKAKKAAAEAAKETVQTAAPEIETTAEPKAESSAVEKQPEVETKTPSKNTEVDATTESSSKAEQTKPVDERQAKIAAAVAKAKAKREAQKQQAAAEETVEDTNGDSAAAHPDQQIELKKRRIAAAVAKAKAKKAAEKAALKEQDKPS